jgi:hypothetical protein
MQIARQAGERLRSMPILFSSRFVMLRFIFLLRICSLCWLFGAEGVDIPSWRWPGRIAGHFVPCQVTSGKTPGQLVAECIRCFSGRGRISIASFIFMTNPSCQRFFGFEGSGLRFQHSIMRVQCLIVPSYSIPPCVATSSKVLLYVNNFYDEKRSSALRKTEKIRGHSCASECSCGWFIVRLVILQLLQ